MVYLITWFRKETVSILVIYNYMKVKGIIVRVAVLECVCGQCVCTYVCVSMYIGVWCVSLCCVGVCVCLCVSERVRERKRMRKRDRQRAREKE